MKKRIFKVIFIYGAVFLIFNVFFAFNIKLYASDTSLTDKYDYAGVSFGADGKPYSKEKMTREPGMYKFSQSLIQVAATCQPYEEDFYKTNKTALNKSSLVPINGYLIKIKGKTKKGNCKFQVIPDSVFGVGFYKCAITPKQQSKLVSAMKNKSKKLIHKTFEYEQKVGKNAIAMGMQPQKGKLDITGDEFTVLINELSEKLVLLILSRIQRILFFLRF